MPHLVRMSEAVSLALHAAGLLAGSSGRLLRTKEMARLLRVSEAHLSKVLQRMTRAGQVKPTRGPGGGFGLARPAEEISLKDIYEAVEGPLDVATCPFNIPACEGGWCVIGKEFNSRSEDLLEFLSETRLSTLKINVGGDAGPSRARSRGSRRAKPRKRAPPRGGGRAHRRGEKTRAGRRGH